jgi:hypothetical protein
MKMKRKRRPATLASSGRVMTKVSKITIRLLAFLISLSILAILKALKKVVAAPRLADVNRVNIVEIIVKVTMEKSNWFQYWEK